MAALTATYVNAGAAHEQVAASAAGPRAVAQCATSTISVPVVARQVAAGDAPLNRRSAELLDLSAAVSGLQRELNAFLTDQLVAEGNPSALQDGEDVEDDERDEE